jgi:CRP-like cAMP-binding protein
MARYPQSDLIHQLFHKGQPMTVDKGQQILGNDQTPDGVYYITSGYVKVYSISNSGDEYLHIIYGAGEVFPILWAFLDIEPDARFYTAISDCVLWRLSREWFNHFIQLKMEVGYAFSIQLAQQFRVLTDRVDNLQYKKAPERIAYRILYLASRFGVKDGDKYVIDPPVTHEIFASSINLARESVSREFEKLISQGVLEQVDHRIVIHDIDALAVKLSRPINLNGWYLT